MILTIFKCVLIIIFGISVTELVGFRGGWFERLGLSFLLGTGIMSVVYFLFIWFVNRVIPTDFWLIIFFLTLLILVLKKPKLIFKKVIFPKITVKSDLVFIFCWSIIGILFVTALINTFYRPVYTTDSLMLFDFRSKIMFFSQKLSSIQIINGWQSYPMFTSMIGLISRFLGTDNPSFYYPLMYLSFALIFYSILRQLVSKNLASIGTLFMYTTPVTLWQSQLDGMTNAPYAIFLCLSIFYIYKVMASEKTYLYNVIISSVFLGLSSWTRGIEPLWVIPLLFIMLISFAKKKFYLPLIYFAIFFPIQELWPLYVGKQYTPIASAGKIVVNTALHNSTVFYGMVLNVSRSMFSLIFTNLGPVLCLFLVFLVFDICFFKKFKSQTFFLFTIMGFLFVLFFGSLYMVVNFSLEIDIFNGSLSRLLSIFPPIMWFCIMVSPSWEFVINKLKLKKRLYTGIL